MSDNGIRIDWVEGRAAGRAATVMRDGHPQSFVDLDDPTILAFEYVQHLACVLDSLSPGPPGPLAVTHVGGAGLSLARYVEATRPGSPQIVLEPDAELTEVVRRELPLPRRHRIRVRPVDGRSGVAALRDGSADVVVVDAYADGRVPPELGTVEFLADVRRVLRPDGVVMLNLADEPAGRYVAAVAAGAVEAGLSTQAVLATHDVLKGRRFGNSVLVAAGSTADLDLVELRRHVARSPFPTGMRSGAELARRARSARALTDALAAADPDAASSPRPPDLGRWRLR
ncbi:spermidine synthase [uncultured Arsenicicoccus sp.]|uniref:spermidine synthase n=2 Tax=uncultured Arsenicicoccus sp. TaxID=491339 RepID=UPI0025914B63|nr:fused MFS/spermidine synthase [uncultured Arsenicicoccus sp.]